MNITPVRYDYRWPDKKARSLKNRLYSTSYTGTIEFPTLVHCFGRDYEYMSIGCYSQILMGGWHYETQIIPDEWDGFSAGPILLPLGEPQVMKACGADVTLWRTEDNIVILNFDVKDIKRKGKYMYQVHWMLEEPNMVEFHYRNVQTGFATKVGAMDARKNVAEWTDMKSDWPYSKVALRIDTAAMADESGTSGHVPKPATLPQPGYEWVEVNTIAGWKWMQKMITVPNPSPGPSPSPTSVPPGSWDTVWQESSYRLQKRGA